MKKYIIVTVSIIGLIGFYYLVISPRQKDEEIQKARATAVKDCDKRYDSVMEELKHLPPSVINQLRSSWERVCSQETQYKFDIDSAWYCDRGTDYSVKAFVHTRDSFINGCVIWTMKNLGYY